MRALGWAARIASPTISLVAAVELAAMAVYAGLRPRPVPMVNDVPDPTIVAANQGAVMWPALLAALSVICAVAILRRPGRPGYLLGGALGVAMLGLALTLPGWLGGSAPLGVLLGLTGAAAVVVAIIGWLPSPPLPESLPGWPEHHGGI